MFGAFLEAFVFGGIASEMQRAQDKEQKIMKLFDYVLYSLDLHKVDPEIKNQVKKYMQLFET